MVANLTDTDLVTSIKRGGKELHLVMKYIYDSPAYRPTIAACIEQIGGSEEDMEEVFVDGIIQCLLNIQAGNYTGQASLINYLSAICENIWFRKTREAQPYVLFEKMPSAENPISPCSEKFVLYSETVQNFHSIISDLDERCKKILSLYSMKYSLGTMAYEVGSRSEEKMKWHKNNCLKNLTEEILSQSTK